jgi:TetR/AcrR family transcriptional regulator
MADRHDDRRAMADARGITADHGDEAAPLAPISPARRGKARERALAAAAHLFSIHGFEGVSLAEVTERAEIGKPNLLYHFDSKEKLWKASVDWLYAQVDAHMEKYPIPVSDQPAEGWSALREGMRHYLEACCTWPAYVRLPLVEGMSPSWRNDWIATRHFRRQAESMRDLVGRLVETGALPPVDALQLQLLMASGQFLLAIGPMVEAGTGVNVADPGWLDSYVDTVIRMLAGEGFKAASPKS